MVLPPHIDLKSPNARSKIISSITSTLSPMFLITVPSLSKHVQSLISDITENQKDRIDKDEVQYKLVLGEENKKESVNIKALLSSVRLGPHCDGNFITLLWSTSPGLQVPKNNGCITPSQINSTGTPTLSVPTEPRREMEDEDWDTVEVTGEDDVVVTIGVDWIRRDLYKGINQGVWCPVLHRVKNGGEERWSLPYLCALEKVEEEES
ncbi:hypothetical protein TrCOL_g10807 [Triparma columacea]|uniref:Uncharacterized protein n=1 Tax=Triparma columacea TaxID=722753 RepID=A0A9W7FZY0_9STRA|nr:hypothetical protein TrCOL_g10807 [Triparma columacea]